VQGRQVTLREGNWHGLLVLACWFGARDPWRRVTPTPASGGYRRVFRVLEPRWMVFVVLSRLIILEDGEIGAGIASHYESLRSSWGSPPSSSSIPIQTTGSYDPDQLRKHPMKPTPPTQRRRVTREGRMWKRGHYSRPAGTRAPAIWDRTHGERPLPEVQMPHRRTAWPLFSSPTCQSEH